MRLLEEVLRHKVHLLLMAVAGAALTTLGLCFISPTYDAQAVVIVDSRRNKLADAQSALSSIVVDQYQMALKSELELVLSHDLAEHVITLLHLLDTPDYRSASTHVSAATRFAVWRGVLLAHVYSLLKLLGIHMDLPTTVAVWTPPEGTVSDDDRTMQNAVEIFRKAFSVINDPKSLTIRMSYRSHSPELAAAVTNAALARYLAADEATKAAAVRRSEAWLHGRIISLRSELDASEKKVEAFRSDHELVTGGNRSPLQEQLLQLAGQRVDAEAGLADARAKLASRDNGDGSAAANADVLTNPLVQSLRQQEAGLLTKQAQLLTTLSPSHPSLLKMNSDQLAKLTFAIRTEVDRLTEAQAHEVKRAESRVADIAQQTGALQARISDANRFDIQLRSLEADAASKRVVLDSFMKRYDEDAGSPLTPTDSRVVSWASVPAEASSPKYSLSLICGTLGFTAFGFGLMVLLGRLRSGFEAAHELSDELGLVVAGLIAEIPALKGRRRTGRVNEPPTVRELSLTVRALAYANPEETVARRVVLVASALPEEGKSTIAISLARSAANGGQRCLLIDADIRNPSLHGKLGTPATPGLVDVMLDDLCIKSVTRRLPGEEFDFLSVGRPTKDMLSPFTNESFGRALTELRARYDVIVIDSAPVLLAAETLVLSACADLTLLLVRWRTTPRQVARRAALLLGRHSAGPCLSVLSRANLKKMRSSWGNRVEEKYRTIYPAS